MSNPLRILQTLDSHLAAAAELTLFGRSALALGYPNALRQFHSTQDVDGILPQAWLEPPEAQDDFWNAVQKTNSDLEADGLYLTHLFREMDVIIQPDWTARRVQLDLGLSKLTIFRPASIDLILTKMARGDDDDLHDIQFLLQQEPISVLQLRVAMNQARVPEIREIKELFERSKANVLAMIDSSGV